MEQAPSFELAEEQLLFILGSAELQCTGPHILQPLGPLRNKHSCQKVRGFSHD